MEEYKDVIELLEIVNNKYKGFENLNDIRQDFLAVDFVNVLNAYRVVKDEQQKIKDNINRMIKEYKKRRQDFKNNNPSLVKEWEEYKPTQISNGVDLSESFFAWLGLIKKIDYKTFKDEMKGGIKE